MTMYRLNLGGGVELNFKRDPRAQVRHITQRRIKDFVPLPEGDHDITPEWWLGRNNHRHIVTAFSDGTGIYRLLPVSGDSRVDVYDDDETLIAQDRGGKTVYIPEDADLVSVIGALRDKGNGVIEILAYRAGPAPK